MKMRLKDNSIRLRLSHGEVERLVETGLLEESVDFTPNPLIYMLHCSKECQEIQVSFRNGWITVAVPEIEVRSWAGTGQVGMEGVFRGVTVLIEKDFACRHGTSAGNEDTFPHPEEAIMDH